MCRVAGCAISTPLAERTKPVSENHRGTIKLLLLIPDYGGLESRWHTRPSSRSAEIAQQCHRQPQKTSIKQSIALCPRESNIGIWKTRWRWLDPRIYMDSHKEFPPHQMALIIVVLDCELLLNNNTIIWRELSNFVKVDRQLIITRRFFTLWFDATAMDNALKNSNSL